jgi:hypothetical protein
MATVKLSKLATLIQMASSVPVIVESRELIMGNMRTKQNVPFAAMYMVQMDPICSKGAVQNVREGHQE